MIKDFHKTAIIAGNRYVSYKEMLRRITYFARYTSPHAGAKTVILSENREGWIYAFFSIWLNRGIAVPVDATATLHALIAARYSALDEVVEALRQTLTTLVAPHYAGPLGADMILYRTSTGSTSINPCVELNLRHTMGMVAAALGQRHAMRGRFVIAPPTTPHRLALTPTSARQAALLV